MENTMLESFVIYMICAHSLTISEKSLLFAHRNWACLRYIIITDICRKSPIIVDVAPEKLSLDLYYFNVKLSRNAFCCLGLSSFQYHSFGAPSYQTEIHVVIRHFTQKLQQYVPSNRRHHTNRFLASACPGSVVRLSHFIKYLSKATIMLGSLIFGSTAA